MALSPLKSKQLHHCRSLSLPSDSHPSTSQFNENLSTIKVSKTNYSSLSSFHERIDGLKNLYYNLDDFLLLPHIQQNISQESQMKHVNQILDGHIMILHSCNTVKDLFANVKHDLQELLSSLRRKDMHGVRSYPTSRRKSKKTIQKSLKDLRSSKSKNDMFKEIDELCMLKEVESVSFSTLQSLLCYMSGTTMQIRKSGWSLVTKMMKSTKDGETDLNEFNKLDAFLQSSQEDNTQIEELVNHLKEMHASTLILEEELGFLFRQLIKTRVSFLNILNH